MPVIWTHRLENAPKRVNHAAASIGHFIYSFGGYSTGEDYQSRRGIDVHRLDTEILKWQLLESSHQRPEDIPFQRYGHTVVAHLTNIYLWGGRNDEGACNELYKFNTITSEWKHMQVTGYKPRSRDGHSATVVGNYMYIFGGFEDEAERFSNDVHCLNIPKMNWSYITTTGDPPRWRDFHTSSCIDQKLFIFGGRSDVNGQFHTRRELYDNTIQYLDLRTKTWVKPETKNDPIGRRSHSAFVYNDCLYIFGGFNGLKNIHFNDLHMFDPSNNTWNLVEAIGYVPSPRRRQSCCLIGHKLYLFGGTSPSSDTPMRELLMEHRLCDQSDLHILDFSPSLETLSKLAIIKHDLDTSCLPSHVQIAVEEVRCESSSDFSRPTTSTG